MARVKVRNFKKHALNRMILIVLSKKVFAGKCSRCADIWCAYNITPKCKLPSATDECGKICNYTCRDFCQDQSIPLTLT